jgi:hypothetical protein
VKWNNNSRARAASLLYARHRGHELRVPGLELPRCPVLREIVVEAVEGRALVARASFLHPAATDGVRDGAALRLWIIVDAGFLGSAQPPAAGCFNGGGVVARRRWDIVLAVFLGPDPAATLDPAYARSSAFSRLSVRTPSSRTASADGGGSYMVGRNRAKPRSRSPFAGPKTSPNCALIV